MYSNLETQKKVFFVGYGSGRPKLLTVRAFELLKAADVVFHEDDADPRILMTANRDAEFIVIQPGAAPKAIKMMVEAVSAGKKMIRLCAGPGFSTLALLDETKALDDQGVAVEIVPGVDPDILAAAYAGIAVVKGEPAAWIVKISADEPDFKALILSECESLKVAASQLIAGGVDPYTPTAFIYGAGTSSQISVTANLEDIAFKAAKEIPADSGLLVVSKTADIKAQLDWHISKPLSRERVVVTRAAHQAGELAERLEELGAEVLAIPTIEIAFPEDTCVIAGAIADLKEGRKFDLIIFTSANGVDFFFTFLSQAVVDMRVLAGVRLAVIGPGTEEALNKHGLLADIVPKDFVAEGMLEALKDEDLSGKRVLIPRALVAREVLPEALAERGAEVIVAPVYETRLPKKIAERTSAMLSSGKITMVTFTSSSTVSNWTEMMNNLEFCQDDMMKAARVACIGPVTANTARKLGYTVDIEASKHTVEGLIEAILGS